MSTPDPQVVRELAREQILNHAKNLAQDDATVFESVAEKDCCIPLSEDEQEDLSDAVLAEIGRAQVTVSWPDGQQDGAAGRVEAYLDACKVDAEPGAARYAIALRLEGVPDDGRDELAADDLRAVVAERKQTAKLLGIGVDREQWDAIAEAEGRRYEYEQTGDTIVGYLAYRYEDIKAQRHILLREIEDRTAELAARVAELTAELDMCICSQPRKVCELRTELDQVHGQLNAAPADKSEGNHVASPAGDETDGSGT